MPRIIHLLVPATMALLSACATPPGPGSLQKDPTGPAPGLAPVVMRAEGGDRDAVHELCYRNKTGSQAPVNFTEAALWCGRGAALGIPSSQVLFAEQLVMGQGITKDEVAALSWYTMAADQGHRHAMLMLYIMHARGSGTQKDKNKAIAFLKRSAEAGHPSAAEELEKVKEGEKTESGRDDAARGKLKAQEALGGLYYHGPLVFQDYPEAVRWYTMAAAQGSLYATNNLGDMYENGRGVPQDYAHAASLYRQAAAKGYIVALHGLASLHESGKGLPKNAALAYTYYRLASSGLGKGYFHDDGAKQAARLAASLSPEELANAGRVVRAWKPGMPLPE